MDKHSKDWKEPKPFKWRTKNLGCDLYKSWTYKRNYKAVTYDTDGDRFEYYIYEISDKENPVLVCGFEDYTFLYEIEERCEQLLKAFAKGKTPGFNAHERKLLEEAGDGKGEFHPENIKFIPFKEQV
ncbi:hypothetical protein [Acinetobacter baumannii]|uniref:hypothetical protein n=1 Tax=Acinetobacter baumannii TaxID=470 RepID=UPI002543D310|nr:hypothetical protein [Acinetobacter baumannii]WIH75502.1 hypothetical protein M2A29_05625 [Acinetobacter baumannii]